MPIDLIITWELLPGSSNAQCNTRHDTFCTALVAEILRQLKVNSKSQCHFRIREEDLLFLNVTNSLSSDKDTTGMNGWQPYSSYSKRDPDVSFGHRKAHYPGIIMEIGQIKANVPHTLRTSTYWKPIVVSTQSSSSILILITEAPREQPVLRSSQPPPW